jgi:hypothetical protein
MSRSTSTGETEDDEERYTKLDSDRCIEDDAAGGAWETC